MGCLILTSLGVILLLGVFHFFTLFTSILFLFTLHLSFLLFPSPLPYFTPPPHHFTLCADGYDVTNLLSADPAVRRRGFKLEYFLRPPVQVTLQFGFQVEVCRVDVELWPWGMDRGQDCKRLEISTSSDPPLPHNHSLDQGAFHLVGRCELTEETHVSFSHPCFRPRPPFPSLPPAPREGCRQEELWSRGPLSLGSVKQLRVTVPYGAGASAMGLKALAVWGLPSRCCPPDEVERVRITHENASLRPVPRLSHLASAQPSPVNQPPALQMNCNSFSQSQSLLEVPEEFLDPLTQEVMLLPMLLPSGVSVDSSTLEEYQRREATWGRVPNDPFTGVPFVPESQALPNPHLKSRIDRFLLQTGLEVREGAVGRQGHGESPHPSRLIPPQRTGESRDSAVTTAAAVESANHQGALSRNSGTRTQTTQKGAESRLSASLDQEQRLSASLDQALLSALQGRPSFTSYPSQTPQLQHKHADTPADTPTGRNAFPISLFPPLLSPLPFLSLPGENRCGSCSCSLSVYSTSPSAYRLPCGHFLCRPCLHRKSRPLVTTAMPNHILCPTCHSPAASSDITHVHH
uniref:U-box domain containing 5 n=1 Tax=Salmo trutta TaxID=8032 RepID=A0A673YU52_SALTR